MFLLKKDKKDPRPNMVGFFVVAHRDFAVADGDASIALVSINLDDGSDETPDIQEEVNQGECLRVVGWSFF